MHDRIIGALETCCRQGEMLRIQNRHVDWDQRQIAIPGAHAKDMENRRIPFDPQGRLAPILKRRNDLGSAACVFDGESGEFQESFKTAREQTRVRGPLRAAADCESFVSRPVGKWRAWGGLVHARGER